MGYSLLSFGCLYFFIPSLPEVIKSVHLATGLNLSDPILNDKAAGIYNTFYNMGSILAPPIGGALNDWIGYRSTNDVMAVTCLVFTFSYVIGNVILIPDLSTGFGLSSYNMTNSGGDSPLKMGGEIIKTPILGREID